MESYQGKAVQDEQRRLSTPQVYVHLQFGVSWSPRHTPQTHGMTYMSKTLRNSSDFPRQIGQPVPKLVAKQTRPREAHPAHHHNKSSSSARPHQTRKPEDRHQTRQTDTNRQSRRPDVHRSSRSDGRAPANDRGSSAPAASHNNPWVGSADYMTPAVPPTHRSHRQQTQATTPPHIWKTLPAPPSQFRLGADGLPWSSWAYPEGYPATDDGQEITEELAAFANNPTTVDLVPEGRTPRRLSEDPARVEELEKLSLALVTVDNGFENQWWYQGVREPTNWPTRDVDDTELLYSPHSDPGDNRLVSAIEQTPTGPDWSIAYDKAAASVRMMVSPISENSISPVESFRPIQRSLTTRSEELFL